MEAIRQARQARQMTQIELAERLGVRQSTVSGWETGHRMVSMAHIAPLCAVLGLQPHEVHPELRVSEPAA